MRSVLNQIQPDLLVTQEIQGLSAANQFLNNVLNVINPGEWSLATFTPSPDTDRACFYRTASADFHVRVFQQGAVGAFAFDRPDFIADSYVASPLFLGDLTGDGLGDVVTTGGGLGSMFLYPGRR